MERRMINGKEQNAVVIPCEEGQVFFTKRREPILKFMMQELPSPEYSGVTHRLALLYHSKEEIEWARRAGYRRYSQETGRCIPWSDHTERCIDYEDNQGTDIYAKGCICLDDIRRPDMVTDPHTGRQRLRCQFRNIDADGTPIMLLGEIYVSEIVDDDIVINEETGHKNVPCAIKKLKNFDRLFNTHVLVVTKADGREVEIGRFREYRNATQTQQRIAQVTKQVSPQQGRNADGTDAPRSDNFNDRPNPNDNPSPILIDGYKF
jgi:hypothetical protein